MWAFRSDSSWFFYHWSCSHHCYHQCHISPLCPSIVSGRQSQLPLPILQRSHVAGHQVNAYLGRCFTQSPFSAVAAWKAVRLSSCYHLHSKLMRNKSSHQHFIHLNDGLSCLWHFLLFGSMPAVKRGDSHWRHIGSSNKIKKNKKESETEHFLPYYLHVVAIKELKSSALDA